MKITIKLRSNVNKSGLQELRIRINSGRSFRKDYDTKLFVDARYWQPQQLKVSNKHLNFIDINRRIKEFKDRIYEANNKFNIGMFGNTQVLEYIKGKSRFGSIDEFIETSLKNGKSDVTYKDYLYKYKGFKKHIGRKTPMTFSEFHMDSYSIFAKFQRVCKQKVKRQEMSASTYKGYVTAMKRIFSYAKKTKAIHDAIEIDNEFDFMIGRKKLIQTYDAEFIKRQIEKCTSLYDWRAIAFWVLMFNLRGFYQADISVIGEEHIEDSKQKKTGRKLTDYWRDNVHLFHPRSKTNVEMYIKLFRKPILALIEMLKNVVVYIDYPNLNRKHVVANINDRIKIYNYTPQDNMSLHKTLWKRNVVKLKEKFEGLTYKTARKSYSTTLKKLGYTNQEIKTQIGQQSDALLDTSYVNYNEPEMIDRINTIHKHALESFGMDEVFELLLAKLKEIVRAQQKPEWIICHNGIHLVNGKWRIMVETDGNMMMKPIDKEYKSYFLKDKRTTKGFYTDEKEQDAYYDSFFKPLDEVSNENVEIRLGLQKGVLESNKNIEINITKPHTTEAEIRLEEFESRLEDYQLNEVLKSKGIGIKT